MLRTRLAPRRRLIERLNAGLWQSHGFARKLTLISAPAGFAKTTLLSERVGESAKERESDLDFSGQKGDDDPARFLGYLARAKGFWQNL